MPPLHPDQNKPRKDKPGDFPMRLGQTLLDKVTAAAHALDQDRSAFAEAAIRDAIHHGLPASISTQHVLDALRRDGRCMLRLSAEAKKRLMRAADQLGLPAATVATLALIGAVQVHEKKAA